MGHVLNFSAFASLLLFYSSPAHAGIDTELTLGSSAKGGLLSRTQPNPWSFGVGYAHRFNLRADFQGLGGGINGLSLPGTGTAVFGQYDDGFVQVDISGRQDSTTFWSYQNASQYDPGGTGSIALSISDLPGSASVRERDGASGIDFFARRDMGSFQLGRYQARWGLMGRFNYTSIDLNNRQSLSLASRQTTDRFPLLGVIPPLAPYTGNFTGPGPLLGTNAIRTERMLAAGATVAGIRDLDADLFAFSFGPWMEFTPADRLSVQLEAGLNLAVIDGNFSQTSLTTLAGTTTRASSRGSDSDLLLGLYLGAGASYSLTETWDIYLRARYEYLDDFSVGAGSARAELSFTDSLVISSGLFFRF